MLRKPKLTKAFWRFFISYFIIFCIPVILVTLLSFTLFITRFQSSTYQQQLSTQQRMNDDMDLYLGELKNISMQFSGNPIDIEQLQENIPERIKLMEMLQAIRALNINLEDVLLWIPTQELFYSSQTSYSQSSYRLIAGDGLIETLMEDWSFRKNTSALTTRLFSCTVSGKQTLFFSCPYPYASTVPTAYLVFNIDPDKLIKSDLPYRLSYYEEDLIDRIGSSADIFTAPSIDTSQDKTLITTHSSDNDITLTTVIDNQKLFSTIYQSRNSFLLGTAGVSLVSIVILSIFSQHNARPINQLNEMLIKLGVTGKETLSNFNDTEKTIAFMEHLAEENKELDTQLLEEQYTSRGLWLSKLINSQGAYLPDILPHLEKYGIRPASPYYAVAMVYVNAQVFTNRYFDEYLFREDGYEVSYYLEGQNRICMLIGSESGFANSLVQLAGTIKSRFADIGFLCEIFLGDIGMGTAHIHQSYINALSIVSGDVVCMGKIHQYHGQKSMQHFYPQVELDSLRSAINNGDPVQITSIISSIVFQMERAAYKDFWYKTVCYEIVNMFIRSPAGTQHRDTAIGQVNRFLYDLSKTTQRDHIILLLKGFGTEIRQLIETNAPAASPVQNKGTVEMADIVAYINQHYKDSQLFLGGIAEQYGLSQNNLSQQLKRVLGMSPGRYINTLRIEEAKKLLTETALPVKEIGCLCGFTETSSFIRNFRTATATTPNQFRITHAP